MSIELSRHIERSCAAEVSFAPERFRLDARSIPDFACEVRKFVYQRTFSITELAKILSRMNQLACPALVGVFAVEIQASRFASRHPEYRAPGSRG